MARCSPASAGWRAYVLPRIRRLLDDYGADGLYDDCGYIINANRQRWADGKTLPTSLLNPTADEVMAFKETPEQDGALTDLLALIYADRTSLEIFTADGLTDLPFPINVDPNNTSLSVCAKGGTADIKSLIVHALNSSWTVPP